jgi:tetratricopeptide (TPR) repeat protein
MDAKSGDQSLADRRALLLGSLLLVALTIFFYIPAMQGGFIWDDDDYVVNNKLLLGLDGLRRIWLSTESVQYYPLVFSSFWLEQRLWGLDPTGYHVVNVLLHSANAVLVWLVCRKLRLKGAWVVAMIFALHPVHVESVAWITERKNVLSGLFYLSAFLAFLKFEETSSRKFHVFSLLLFVMGLLSKTVVCTLPVALIIVRWMRKESIDARYLLRLLPFFAVGFAMGLVTVWWEANLVGAGKADWDIGLMERLLLPGRVPWFYAAKLIAPINLSFIYPRWDLDPTASGQWLYTALTIVVLAALYSLRGRLGRAPFAGASFFIVTLFPALGFIKVYPFLYSFVADHFQYLASLGVIALAVGTADRFIARPPVKFIAGATTIAVLGTLTWQQGYVYKDVETLWKDTIRKNPNALIAYNNLGVELTSQGRHKEAAQSYLKLAELNPGDFWGRVNLGNSLERLGRYEEAFEHYQAALSMKPNDVMLLNYIGLNFEARGDHAEARKYFGAAIEKSPLDARAYGNTALVLVREGRTMEAIDYYLRAIEITPGDADAHNNLGVALAMIGRIDEATEQFKETLRLDPENASARKNLEKALSNEKTEE